MIRSARVAPTRFSTFSRFRDPVAATFEPRSNSIIHAVHSIVAVPEVNIPSEWPPLPATSIIPRLGIRVIRFGDSRIATLLGSDNGTLRERSCSLTLIFTQRFFERTFRNEYLCSFSFLLFGNHRYSKCHVARYLI